MPLLTSAHLCLLCSPLPPALVQKMGTVLHPDSTVVDVALRSSATDADSSEVFIKNGELRVGTHVEILGEEATAAGTEYRLVQCGVLSGYVKQAYIKLH